MTSRLLRKRSKTELEYPLSAVPMEEKAVEMVMVVMLNEPVSEGARLGNMYWMLLLSLRVCDILRSIFRSVNGSSVALICTSCVVAEVAGVESVVSVMSQPFSRALSM